MNPGKKYQCRQQLIQCSALKGNLGAGIPQRHLGSRVSPYLSGTRNAISIYNYSLNGWNGFRRPCRREAGRLSPEGNQHVLRTVLLRL